MSAIQGVSASFSVGSSASVGRIRRSNPVDPSQFQTSFEKDLSQSGLKSGVTSDDLLSAIQSSISDAVKDPSNSGKDLFEVIQSSIKKSLEDNGVDTDKLAELLRADAQANQTYGPLPAYQNTGSQGPSGHGQHKGPPPGGPPPGGPPPGGPPPSDGSVGSSSSTYSTDDDDDESGSSSDSATESFESVLQSTIASNSSSSDFGNQTNFYDTSRIKTQFEHLVANFIKNLPSGSLLDLKA